MRPSFREERGQGAFKTNRESPSSQHSAGLRSSSMFVLARVPCAYGGVPMNGLAQLAPLSVTPVSNPDDTNQVTAQTVGLMLQYIDAAASQPPVLRATCAALAGIGSDAAAWRKATAIHRWVRGKLSFVPHEFMLREMGFQGDEQLLIPPYLFLDSGFGDCPMFTMLMCSMLKAAGVPSLIVTIAADPCCMGPRNCQCDPNRWSHVYSVAVMEDGSLLPVDASHGSRAGWESATAYRRQEWAVN